MDGLAPLCGILGNEAFLLVFLKTVRLVQSNALSMLSFIADRVLVAEIAILEAFFNAPHL